MGIQVTPPGPATSLAPQASLSAFGSATAPTAGAAIVTLAAPAPGTYQITVYEYLTGTVTAADQDNMTVQVNGVIKGTILEPGVAAGATMPAPFTLTVSVPAGNITVNAIGAGGASAVYHVSIVATRIA
jgi:hypothetical protein